MDEPTAVLSVGETETLFEQIRREYEHGAGTIKGVARKFGVHRRMVRREAVAFWVLADLADHLDDVADPLAALAERQHGDRAEA